MCALLEGADKTVNKRLTLVAVEMKRGAGIRNNIKVPRRGKKNTIDRSEQVYATTNI